MSKKELVAQLFLELTGDLITKAADVAEDFAYKVKRKNAAIDQAEQDRLKELNDVAVLGGAND